METITLKKYRGRGNNYLILDPNKNDIHLQERNIEMLCKRILEAMQSVYCMDRS